MGRIKRQNYLFPFQKKLLQKQLENDLHTKQRQGILIMLLADEGKTQTEICRLLGCCHSTVKHWILGQTHLIFRRLNGQAFQPLLSFVTKI